MYFVEKVGCYSHGIFKISENMEECVDAAAYYARRDIDSYHRFNVYKFKHQDNAASGACHELVYSCNKGTFLVSREGESCDKFR